MLFAPILLDQHICAKIGACPVHYLLMDLKHAGCMANSVNSDQLLCSVTSDIGLHYRDQTWFFMH